MTSQMSVLVRKRCNVRWAVLSVSALAALVSLPAMDAHALSTRVKLACAKDYFAHCKQHAPGSPGVRKCMRAVGDGLSPRCVNALMAAGEVSEKEVAEHQGR